VVLWWCLGSGSVVPPARPQLGCARFFDAADYIGINFAGTGATRTGPKSGRVTGDLTIKVGTHIEHLAEVPKTGVQRMVEPARGKRRASRRSRNMAVQLAFSNIRIASASLPTASLC